jgi:hypothetical protein
VTTTQSNTAPARAVILADLGRRLSLAGHNELRVVERVVERLEIRRERDILDDMADDLVNLIVDQLLLEDAEVDRKHEAAREQIVPSAAQTEPDAIEPGCEVR